MKKEVAFFKDRRGGFSAKNLIALYRALGYTDKQIKEEMLKLKAEQEREADKPAAFEARTDAAQRTGMWCPDHPDTEFVVYCPVEGCHQPRR